MIRVLVTTRDKLNEIAGLQGKTQIDVVEALADKELASHYATDVDVATALRKLLKKADDRTFEQLQFDLWDKLQVRSSLNQVTRIRPLLQ